MKEYCGPDKGIIWGIKIKPPLHIFFNASCKKHDELYSEGGDELDRFNADRLFLLFMERDVSRLSKYKLFYSIWCYIYFVSVRIGGKKHFNYNEK